ncbi:MAG: XdhC family protein [Runella sp.]
MKEIRAIIEAYQQIDPTKTKAALATVIKVEGSSYRRTGARMLVSDDGQWVGGISGGCLEGDALKRARLAIAKNQPSVVTYDTTQDDQHQIGVGLGCNGVIEVLFTPLDFANDDNPLELLKKCTRQSRQTHILLTITQLNAPLGRLVLGKMLHYTGVESLDCFDDENLRQPLADTIQIYLQKGRSRPQTFLTSEGQEIEVFIEILPPEPHLVLIGHQYDVLPLARLVKEIGWRVSVVAQPSKVMNKIFAIADQIVPPDLIDSIPTDQSTAFVLMAHDFKTDKYNLPKTLKTNAPYIGLLGPKVRSERIFDELKNEGFQLTDQDMSRIYAPTGLDIGAITPEEIALSIVAEVRAVFAQRDGKSLRDRSTPIHERT